MNDVPAPPPPPEQPQQPPVPGAQMAGAPPMPPMAPPVAPYPINISIQHQPEYSRFLPLVKWILLIPQYIVYIFLAIGALFVWFAAFFAVLFTAKYPRGMWDYMVGVQRWGLRINAYAYFATDKYPPYTLQETPEDTVRLYAVYPEHVDRWRALFSYLVAIPYLFVAYIVSIIGQVCSMVAFFTIIFTKQIPVGLFDWIRKGMMWQTRGSFYAAFMSTLYPPFDWDE